MDADSGSIRASGWRQGSMVRTCDAESLLNASIDQIPPQERIESETSLVVISQDCDLFRESNHEPFVEILLCNPVQDQNPLYLNGRNPRILHIPAMNLKGAESILEIIIQDRFRVMKNFFQRLYPDNSIWLKDRYVGLLAGWIAKRYERPAFPDEFNSRLKIVDKRLEKLFKSDSSRLITGIYITGANEEKGGGKAVPVKV